MSARRELLTFLLLAAWAVPVPLAGQEEEATTSSPYEAYEAGRYDEALEGFLDEEVTRPEDPRVLLNRGSAQYKLGDYEDAAEAFRRASEVEQRQRRARALYNLGNTAYRQQRLEEAIDYYRQAIELAPDDLDAKFNLEYVQREQELQQQQQQQNQQGQQDQQDEQQEQQPGEGEGDPQQQPQSQEEGDSSDSSPSQPQGQPGESGQQDSDGDGLPDEREQGGSNPTDPRDPDSDDDGLPDGAEDLDRDGSLDPGETDPNRADSDGDGIPDGADRSPTGGQEGPAEAQQAQQGMSPEEAQRYLDALEEGRPDRKSDGRGQRTRSGKDW